MAQFTKHRGLVYLDFDRSKHIKPLPTPPPSFMKIIAGVDWCYNHPTAIAVFGITPEHHYYLLEEFYMPNITTQEAIQELRRIKQEWGVNIFYCDHAEPDRIEEAKRTQIYAIAANKHVINGINYIINLPAIHEEGVFFI